MRGAAFADNLEFLREILKTLHKYALHLLQMPYACMLLQGTRLSLPIQYTGCMHAPAAKFSSPKHKVMSIVSA